MNPESILATAATTLIALGSASILVRWLGGVRATGRYASVDGFRGYLAFWVFVHHSALWYATVRDREWGDVTGLLFQLGPSSVALFFMITGFLFISKLLDARDSQLDWVRLFVSRVLRLTPLYLGTLVLMFFIVGCETGFRLMEPGRSVGGEVGHWLLFNIFKTPAVNGFADTGLVTAGVTWTLRYEWIFYLSLPLFALLLRVKVALGWVVMGLVGCATLLLSHRIEFNKVTAFGGGIAAAFLVRRQWFRTMAQGRWGSPLVLISLGSDFFFHAAMHDLHRGLPLVALTGGFCLIAGGSTLFGMFASRSAKMLGEIAYSLYLLHGLLLFCIFRVLFGASVSASFSILQHWLVVCCSIPLLVAGCFATFRFIERPSLELTPAVTLWIRRRFSQSPPTN